jgi:hypothetical protein
VGETCIKARNVEIRDRVSGARWRQILGQPISWRTAHSTTHGDVPRSICIITSRLEEFVSIPWFWNSIICMHHAAESRFVARSCLSPAPYLPLTSQRFVQIESGRDQCQMAECLRGIAHLFARNCDFFREDIQMIPKAEHVFKNAHRLAKILFFIRARLIHVSKWPVNFENCADIPS